jgi:Rieske Fe-S protein
MDFCFTFAENLNQVLMKTRFFFSSLLILTMITTACNTDFSNKEHDHQGSHQVSTEPLASTGNFGEVITKENALQADVALEQIIADTTFDLKLTGTISEVCQHSGCWLTIELDNGEELMVNMLDHAYEVPKDAAGKKVWAQGVAVRELIPVEMLKHYAADAGKSQEEIDAISSPEWKFTMDAAGVIIE